MDETLRQIISPPEAPDRESLLRGEEICALCAAGGSSCCGTDPAFASLSFPLSAPEWRRLRPYLTLASISSPEDLDQAARGIAVSSPEGPSCGEFTSGEAPLRELSSGELSSGEAPRGEPSPGDLPPREGDAACAAEDNSLEFLQAMSRLFPGERALLERIFPPGGRHFRLRLRADGSCVFQGRSGCCLPRGARPWYCLLFPAWIRGGSVALFQSEGCLLARRAASPAQGLILLRMTAGKARRLYAALRKDWRLDPGAQGKNTATLPP